MLLALVMLCSLCVNALAADEVKVNSALSATELEKSASAQTVRVTVAPASAVTVSNYEVKLEVPKGWTITNIENDDPNAALTAADYNLANGQMGWTSKDAEDKSVSKFATYTVEIPANTAAGKYELKVVGVMADKNYGQDAVLTKGQHDSTLTLTVKATPPSCPPGTPSVRWARPRPCPSTSPAARRPSPPGTPPPSRSSTIPGTCPSLICSSSA